MHILRVILYSDALLICIHNSSGCYLFGTIRVPFGAQAVNIWWAIPRVVQPFRQRRISKWNKGIWNTDDRNMEDEDTAFQPKNV